MPRFPLISWRKNITSANNSIRVVAGGVATVVTITPGLYYGYSDNGAGTPQADSLAVALSTAIDSHANVVSVTPVYLDLLPGNPLTRYTIDLTAFVAGDGIDWAHVSTTATASMFGFDQTLQAFTADPAVVDSDFNADGFFLPNRDGSDDQPVANEIAFGTRSPYVPSAHVRVSWGRTRQRVIRWPYVDAAYVYLLHAQNAQFAAVAGRVVTDPNNNLEKLIRTVAEDDLDMRLFTAFGAYVAVTWSDLGELRSDVYAVRTTVGKRRYDVTAPLTET